MMMILGHSFSYENKVPLGQMLRLLLFDCSV